MAKTRLTQAKRQILRNHARNVVTTIIRAELNADQLDQQVQQMALQYFAHEYPESDMRVLARYDVAKPNDSVRVMLRRGDEVLNRYCESMSLPVSVLLPSNYDAHTCIVEGPVVEQWFDYRKAIDGKITERLSDYRSLISQARNYEELLEVWPGADAVRDQLGAQNMQMVPVTGDVMKRIHQDMIRIAALGGVKDYEDASCEAY